LALVMVVLALVLAAGSIHRSYRAAQDLGLRRAFPADMAVYGGQRLDATFTSRVGATPGVQSVTELRFGETNVEGRGATRVFLSVIDPDTFFAVQPLPWVAGSDGSARRALQRGDAVIVPQGLARRFGVGMGGRLDLTTAQGRHRFSVVGIYPTNDSFRSVTVGLPDARRYFNAGDANSVAVRLAPGADPHAVSEAIQAGMRTHGGAFVRLTSSDKARARKALNDYFRLVYVVLLVAGTMGLLGLGNTLAMSVIRRTREIGVLRAIGTRQRQVWGLVLVEAATLSLVALALALPLGWLLSATVYDGSGGPSLTADVAVTGTRMEAVGDLAGEGAGAEVDGRGLALAPGFIDVHSHDDFAVFLMPEMDFKVGQGVTTDVVGNCGLGAAPFGPARRYLGFFGADQHASALPDWDTYGEYLDALDGAPPSLNVAVLVGHGTVRLDAMGNERREPDAAEMARMLDTLAEGMDAGCVGYSTGLIYEPGRYSASDELVGLARLMARTGALYASHMRNEGEHLLDAVAETIAIGEQRGVPVQISHHKASGAESWGLVEHSLGLIDEARARGVDVTADQYPYTAGSTSLFAVLQNYEEGTAGVGAPDWTKIV